MIVLLAITQGITLILLVAVAVALLAVARQVGVLHERVAPAGALTPRQGPAVGSPAPRIQTTTLTGDAIEIGGALRPGARRMLFFVSAQCPICKKLIPFARSFARAEGIELVFAGDDDAGRQARLVADHGLSGHAFVNDGTLLARGLVNSREHLESMVVSHESGMASVQDYLKARLAKPA